MKAPAAEQVTAALEPARAELLRAARADADAIVERARQQAAEVLGNAAAEAEAIVEQARSQGERDGAAAGRAVLTRARRQARALRLAVRGRIYHELRTEVAERIKERLEGADRLAIRQHLADRARRLLGPGTEITEHPDGGVTGHLPGRMTDLTAGALASRALDRLGAEAETLWSP